MVVVKAYQDKHPQVLHGMGQVERGKAGSPRGASGVCQVLGLYFTGCFHVANAWEAFRLAVGATSVDRTWDRFWGTLASEKRPVGIDQLRDSSKVRVVL